MSLILSEQRQNEALIEILNQVAIIYTRRAEPFKAKAYQKAIESIELLTFMDITAQNYKSILKGLPGIGSSIMEKCTEYLQKGNLLMIEEEKTNPMGIFTNVYGIGPKKAQDLIKTGITSIKSLRENAIKNSKLLTKAQKAGLDHYEDLLERIPRSEIDEYDCIFKTFLDNRYPKTSYQYSIVGSYRRGATTSGDIDVILSGLPDQMAENSSKIYNSLIDYLIEKKIIKHVLSRGENKCLVISQLDSNPLSSSKHRRIDFLCATPIEYPFSLFYFTGSKNFNTSVRHYALTQGYTMNEHEIKSTTTASSMNELKLKEKEKIKTERDIFAFLGLQYKEPWERIDGRDVITLK